METIKYDNVCMDHETLARGYRMTSASTNYGLSLITWKLTSYLVLFTNIPHLVFSYFRS